MLAVQALACFTPAPPKRWAGRSAGSGPGVHDQPGKVARHEAVDFKSAPPLAYLSQVVDPKRRLLGALLSGQAAPQDLSALVSELLATTGPGRVGEELEVGAFDGTWNLLSAGRMDSPLRTAAPRFAIYSGGRFLHEGSIHNGGLFSAVLETQAAELKLGVPKVRISEGRVDVSVHVEAASGKKTLSYSTSLTRMSSRYFQRSLLSLELPKPVGNLTPLLENVDMVAVVYSDKDLLVMQDEKGQFEFLVDEQVQPRSLSDSSSISMSREAFIQSAVAA